MKLSPLFTSHMVFAAGKPIRVFGSGSGHVSVLLNGISAEQDVCGPFWTVELPPMACGGPYTCTICLNEETILLEDVSIGYVYLFAGQSNMQFKLRESNTPDDQWNTEPMLRLFSTDRMEAGEVFSAKDGWLPCHRDTVGDWSAIAYLTGKQLVKHHSAAVGAVACYQGASVIESWVPSQLFADHGIDIPISDKHTDHTYPQYAVWNGNGTLYQYALAQVFPFSLSGILWYQGESDTTPAEGAVYAEELCLMIDQWRKDFQDPALPFVIIQIADYLPRSDEGWRMIQDAQEKAVSMREHVYMIPCADICEKDCIHPPSKQLLADRIADLLSGNL